MYRQKNRFLFALLCTVILCSFAQATILQISVQDRSDNSTIPDATVFLNGDEYAKTTTTGQVFLNHSGLNDLSIRVSMTGYEDWKKLVAKNETSVFVTLSRMNITLKVNLYDSDSLGAVSGARINISAKNGNQTNLTDGAGSATFGVNATTLYSMGITAPGYLPRIELINTGTENKEAQFWMFPANRFSFIVKDKNGMLPVADAEVRIDNALVGETDSRGILTVPVTRGKVTGIDIKKGGYQTFTESRRINETDALYSVSLSKALLGAVISVSDENRIPVNGAEVFINGTLSGSTNQSGRITFPDLVSDSYNVEVRKAGYRSINRTIVIINKGEDFTFEIPVENADLTIFVQEKDLRIVPNATILLNGNTIGVTDDHGLFRTRVRFNTLYNITALKDTYQPVSVQKEFARGNATVSATLIMEKNQDWGIITLIVIGAAGVLIAFGIIRKRGGQKPQRSTKKNNDL
ncbi:MAG: carboxypeptidase-like regulatory domain-containing protein [Methanoregula sp.]|nr:carboxypeptidase-like regulatory domain-containing protein [Methanoregula sp.]